MESFPLGDDTAELWIDEAPRHLPSSGAKEALSKEEWEDLRPLIQSLYIKENRTFANIARVLFQKHNFKPTKRQFDERIKKWNMRKNTKRYERRAILKSVGVLGEGEIVEVSGRRYTPRKLERWQRELAGEPLFSSQYRHPEGSKAFTGLERTRPTDLGPFSAIDVDQSNVEQAPKMIQEDDGGDSRPRPDPESADDGPSSAMVIDELPLDFGIEMLPEAIEGDSWPFSRWAKIDVIRSPKLTSLFENMRIENGDLPDDIDALILSPMARVSISEEESPCISAGELTMTSYERTTSNEDWQPASVNTTALLLPSPRTACLVERTEQTPFKSFHSDVWFPRPPSPFHEVYFFPPASPKQSQAVARYNASAELKKASDRLSGLRRAGFRDHDINMLQATHNSADTFFSLGSFKHAANLYRSLTSIYRDLGENHSYGELSSQLYYVTCLGLLHRSEEAERVLNEVYPAVLTSFGPHHDLMRIFLEVKFSVMYYNSDYGSGEDTCRELLQMSLAEYGPRHENTASALRYLGMMLMYKAIHSESERLHRLAIQLSQEDPKLEENSIVTLRELAQTFASQDLPEEAVRLLWLARERGIERLGEESRTVMDIEHNLGRELRKPGPLEESEAILRTCLQKRTKRFGEDDLTTLSAMNELSQTLCEMEKYKEAATWLEKCFRLRVQELGPGDQDTVITCEWLGRAYRRQGLYNEALALYQDLKEKILELHGDDHDELPFLQDWIDWTIESLAEVSESVEEVEDVTGDGEEHEIGSTEDLKDSERLEELEGSTDSDESRNNEAMELDDDADIAWACNFDQVE